MALLFNDVGSEYAEVDNSPISGFPWTMACWFRSDDLTIDQVLMWLGDKDVADQYVFLGAAGTFAGDTVIALTDAGGISSAETSTGYSADTWHLATGVWVSSTDRRAYIDGGSKGTNTTSRVLSNASDRVSIGRAGDSTPGNYMSGRIAEAAIWDVALTDTEIARLLRQPFRYVRPANLVAYWPLWGLHSPEIDLSGNGRSIAKVNFDVGAGRANHAPVTTFTPKWAASMPVIEAAAAAGGIRNPMGGPTVLRNPLGLAA